jgi:hypothetical protein
MSTTVDCNGFTPQAWSNGARPAWSFPVLEVLMNSLAPIEEIWARLPDPTAIAELGDRELTLGVATISCRAFELLHELITSLGVEHMIARHPPSLTAAAKQTLLDAGGSGVKRLVNKTVTVRLGTTHLLCTGAGDFTLNRCHLTTIAGELRLSKKVTKACRINPPDYSPESELGLLTGMVSPFFAPSRCRPRLQAVVLLGAAKTGVAEEQMVAISLSPFESLIVSRADFHTLAQLYSQRAYPDVEWATIDC